MQDVVSEVMRMYSGESKSGAMMQSRLLNGSSAKSASRGERTRYFVG